MDRVTRVAAAIAHTYQTLESSEVIPWDDLAHGSRHLWKRVARSALLAAAEDDTPVVKTTNEEGR